MRGAVLFKINYFKYRYLLSKHLPSHVSSAAARLWDSRARTKVVKERHFISVRVGANGRTDY